MTTHDVSIEGSGEQASLASELRKEGSTMSLYIAVSLLAALTALSGTSVHSDIRVAGTIWGTTIGLAAAHLFAFRLSARLVGAGEVHEHDAKIAMAQLAGAAMVALLCTIPVLLFADSSELDAVRLVLAAYIALIGYQVAIANGSTRTRAITYAAVVLATALAIAIAKNVLAGH